MILLKRTKLIFCILLFTNYKFIFCQPFSALYQLETLCKCGKFDYTDSLVQNALVKNREFFLQNSRNAMMTLNYYAFKNDTAQINATIHALCELGVTLDNSFKSNCKNLYQLNTSIHCNNSFDSTEIKRITAMYETEQNIRTFYKPAFGFPTIKNIMTQIDSLNMHLIDSLYIKPNKFPNESEISSQCFYKLFLVLFHNVSNMNENKWKELQSFLYLLLEKGILHANYYAMLVDRYLEKNNFPLMYGEGLTAIGTRITEVNDNRVKIGLRKINVACD